MPALGQITSLIATTVKPFAAKSLGPTVSSTVIRQPPSQQQANYSSAAVNRKPVITESAILNSFPRPNLETTLHSSPSMFSLQALKMSNMITKCINCSGPHSTEFCPC